MNKCNPILTGLIDESAITDQLQRHSTPGIISERITYEEFSRLEKSDTREIYSHRNRFIDANIEILETGGKAGSVETAGDDGPQVSAV